MAVVKLSGSGRGVLFIDDEGNVFLTSLSFVLQFLHGDLKRDVLFLKRLPVGVGPDKFGRSEVLDPAERYGLKTVDKGESSFSRKFKKDQEQKVAFVDKKVW